ncbi:TIGR02680 family protein, partial [Weissella cibaria]|nr:TIGR02680 family protein [Weissella cibaria]
DPFGTRVRKLENYLLEENDGREERTGYLYMEFKRKDSDSYITIGIGLCAKRNKKLDSWHFIIRDGRRIGRDFFLYKELKNKITLSRVELTNRLGEGGQVIDGQNDYMKLVNDTLFGYENVEEYKELVDLLIQLRTPKLSKDF